jgi:hypothetical protein
MTRSPFSRLVVDKALPRAFCVLVLGAQLYAVVNAYHDPLKRFGYQPFAESSVYRAQIFAVARTGERDPVADGFQGYRWQELVHERVGAPFSWRSAPSGINATLYFLQRALDYVATHTPNDRHTAYLEAHVSYHKNRGPEEQVTLRSRTRSLP